jgi:hypothetical protein
VERTGTAETSAPSKRRKEGAYDERRIILGGLWILVSEEAGAYVPPVLVVRNPIRS